MFFLKNIKKESDRCSKNNVSKESHSTNQNGFRCSQPEHSISHTGQKEEPWNHDTYAPKYDAINQRRC